MLLIHSTIHLSVSKATLKPECNDSNDNESSNGWFFRELSGYILMSTCSASSKEHYLHRSLTIIISTIYNLLIHTIRGLCKSMSTVLRRTEHETLHTDMQTILSTQIQLQQVTRISQHRFWTWLCVPKPYLSMQTADQIYGGRRWHWLANEWSRWCASRVTCHVSRVLWPPGALLYPCHLMATVNCL